MDPIPPSSSDMDTNPAEPYRRDEDEAKEQREMLRSEIRERYLLKLKQPFRHSAPQSTKCDEKSREFVRQGKEMSQKKFNEAIQKYAQGIAAARSYTEGLCRAYLERAEAAYKSRAYLTCLLDTNRALNCDDNKLSQFEKGLYNRGKKICRKRLAKEEISISLRATDPYTPTEKNDREWEKICPTGPKKASEYLPVSHMSNKIEIARDETSGKGMAAKEDIKAGEVLFIEQCYVKLLDESKLYTHCSHCFVRCEALIPCDTCNKVMYCSEDCRIFADQYYHQPYECKMRWDDAEEETFSESPEERRRESVLRWNIVKKLALRALLLGTDQGKPHDKIPLATRLARDLARLDVRSLKKSYAKLSPSKPSLTPSSSGNPLPGFLPSSSSPDPIPSSFEPGARSHLSGFLQRSTSPPAGPSSSESGVRPTSPDLSSPGSLQRLSSPKLGEELNHIHKLMMRFRTVEDIFRERSEQSDGSDFYVDMLSMSAKYRPSTNMRKRLVAYAVDMMIQLKSLNFFDNMPKNRDPNEHEPLIPSNELPEDMKKSHYFVTLLLINHLYAFRNGYFAVHQFDTPIDRETAEVIGYSICPLQSSKINHACNPNTRYFLRDRENVIIATRPIKKKEQITIPYLCCFENSKQELCSSLCLFFNHELTIRQELLELTYGFQCICLACTQDWPRFDKAKVEFKDGRNKQNLRHELLQMTKKYRKDLQINLSIMKQLFEKSKDASNKEVIDTLADYISWFHLYLKPHSWVAILTEEYLLKFMAFAFSNIHANYNPYHNKLECNKDILDIVLVEIMKIMKLQALMDDDDYA